MNNILKSFLTHTPHILICILLALSYGCASAPDGRVILRTAKYRAEGYTQKPNEWTFKNSNIILRVQQVNPDWRGAKVRASALVKDLHKEEYLLLRLVIRNDSDFNIIYNPALTTFKGGRLGYKKPLDYTDLYSIFRSTMEDTDTRDYKEIFYDLSITIRPGDRSSRLLAFKPANKKVRKGELTIQNLYVEKEIINFNFPFIMKTEE